MLRVGATASIFRRAAEYVDKIIDDHVYELVLTLKTLWAFEALMLRQLLLTSSLLKKPESGASGIQILS